MDYYNADVVTANDYYPFGSQMPGRKFAQANSSYRYGFNGQEKSNEINENSYTAEFWQYDGRIGRRFNVDPKPKIGISDYATLGNNPIWYTDILGDKADSTGYYSNSGELLYQTTGKGYSHAVVVNDDKIAYIKAIASNPTAIANSQNNAFQNAIDNQISKNGGVGVTYDLNSIKAFLKNNRNRIGNFLTLQDKVDGTKLSSYGKLSVNGKPISGIRSETTGGLVLKNNIVGVGNVKYFKNIGVVNQSDLPDQSEPFFVGGIHDHPFGGNKTKVDYYQKGLLGSFQGYFFFDNKPSGSEGDKGNGNDPKTGYRNVLIDDKNIFLYDKSHPDIKIPF